MPQREQNVWRTRPSVKITPWTYIIATMTRFLLAVKEISRTTVVRMKQRKTGMLNFQNRLKPFFGWNQYVHNCWLLCKHYGSIEPSTLPNAITTVTMIKSETKYIQVTFTYPSIEVVLRNVYSTFVASQDLKLLSAYCK